MKPGDPGPGGIRAALIDLVAWEGLFIQMMEESQPQGDAVPVLS